ncbi:hypothetical protein VKI21_15570 [Cyanobacterium aponinum UTEX 3222]|uniref:Uncharacterized protein n=2 Tax=Cyanobacterium aponinum TaxID=379064 RepID=A0A844GR49_9CHRO|nr:hypothetical protein [Cyanobacterium aponinum]WRL41450.1 hypothetical protein VKI21_15570 [Cyanobacterium aponinum UTEX 3222]MTF39014.1 hypothetical protein [Cyanobacterium aponinum 0216]PHV62415.1 hypothetical protein CSQ80_10565 [Cyanobacterium aponinum IPPAS B-1201]WPF89674.1 hypothetical protein SAY89_05225 [Cyanobacterium aponinum AL20115]WRL38071.1 hypothetical protein VKI22_15830 [Cyanobacterium aponinum UTEX 3221]
MLHLAEVIRDTDTGKLLLNLLAVEESKLQWTFCNNQYIPLDNDDNFKEGLLLLVELNNQGQILRCQSAKDWILNLLKEYLIEGNFRSNINIPEEEARLEKWRQELTSQSQDLTRIRLEVETRREELQELEQTLSWEKEKLKSQHQ